MLFSSYNSSNISSIASCFNISISDVSLILKLDDIVLEDERNIIVSREINVNGHNSCKINGRLVTVSELKEFMNNENNFFDICDQAKTKLIETCREIDSYGNLI